MNLNLLLPFLNVNIKLLLGVGISIPVFSCHYSIQLVVEVELIWHSEQRNRQPEDGRPQGVNQDPGGKGHKEGQRYMGQGGYGGPKPLMGVIIKPSTGLLAVLETFKAFL